MGVHTVTSEYNKAQRSDHVQRRELHVTAGERENGDQARQIMQRSSPWLDHVMDSEELHM